MNFSTPPPSVALADRLFEAGKFNEAAAVCGQVLLRNPKDANALHMLALVRERLGDVALAVETLRQAIGIAPRVPEMHNNLGHLLRRMGQTAEAVDAFQSALTLRPDYPKAHSNLLYAMQFDPRFDPKSGYDEHVRWASRYASRVPVQTSYPNDRTADRRLRVGYVSPNFRSHSIMAFMEPVLAAHDHGQVEVFCYSDVRKPDQVTARLQPLADQWRVILGQDDAAVATLIRNDAIDILVDLTGHLAQNRILLFARKPAPIQVSYIGYHATTGLQTMDWRVTDEHGDPPGADQFFTERLYRLPQTGFVYQPPASALDIGPAPLERNGYATFGSFNHTGKLTPAVIDAWSALLRRVPSSRLIVLIHEANGVDARVSDLFAQHGVGDRVTLVGRKPEAQYLQLITESDLALDPFPFGGHTTTLDALWMGVATVTQYGQTFVSRCSASVLRNAGLSDLVATSLEQYIDIAATLASDARRLSDLRRSLRQRMQPLIDEPAFTRRLETAYREMWRDWCAA